MRFIALPHRKVRHTVTGAVVALLLSLFASTAVMAVTADAAVLPATANPYGRTYSEWAASWWQWVLSQPAASNPLLDTTGAYCGQQQSGPVWFLAGSLAGAVMRDCTIPAGKALLFPVLNKGYFAFLTDPPDQRTEAYVRSQVADVGDATNLFATIDRTSVTDVPRYLERSVLFQITLPAGNVFGLDTGFLLDPCADEGYYLVVAPPPPGPHTLHFGGTFADGSSVDTTYNLTIQPDGS